MSVDPNGSVSDSLSRRLEDLSNETQRDACHRERTAFNQAAQPFGERIVLFGAGGFGRRTLAGMRRVGLEPLAFADNNSRLWGTSIEGIRVYSSPDAARLFGHTATFLVTIWNGRAKDTMLQRIQQLTILGCKCVCPAGLLFWKYPEVFLPYYPLDLPHKALPFGAEIKAALQLFRDEASRREYVAQVAFRLLLDYNGLGWPEDVDHYFPPDLFNLGEKEQLVDCGAFDGDTIAAFVRRQGESFDSIIAFEPDSLNWEKLQQRIQGFPESIRRKIFSFPQALGSRHETVYFDPTGTDLSAMGQGSVAVECVTLDEALWNLGPTLIKFDIEGSELHALEGARELIPRCRPVLAVSAYHEQGHLWQVPLKLAATCKDYRFFLRPHGTEGWDLVCYAIPSERLRD
jgi:FkbM family methyltransferase